MGILRKLCLCVMMSFAVSVSATDVLTRLQNFLNPIDTNYVEPQHYNFKVALKNITTYEVYTLSTDDGKNISFSPKPHMKTGPYIGWRLFSLGYTIDFSHINLMNKDRSRMEYDLSVYSSMLALDLYYRKTGNDYKIRGVDLGDDYDGSKLKGKPFGGVSSSVKGFNLHYIFNHKKFSYPAAFSQSTVQRRSAGSPLVGIGYTKHKMSVDWEALDALSEEVVGEKVPEAVVDSAMRFSTVEYSDISVSGGWAYNWAFARNWLFAVSVTGALGYQYSKSNNESEVQKPKQNQSFAESLSDFSNTNLTIDGVLRLGLVWNNTRWYAGANSVMHSYNYHRSNFYINNTFGSVTVYVGYNFGLKKGHLPRKLRKKYAAISSQTDEQTDD